MPSTATESVARELDARGPWLLYDGDCGFCARTVQFVLRHERQRHTLHFASLQGAFGDELRAQHGALEGVDSIIWYEPAGAGRAGRVLVRSDAALQALTYLGGPWLIFGALGRIVPRALRDAVYDVVARNRRRLSAGDSCVLPTAEQRARFPELGRG